MNDDEQNGTPNPKLVTYQRATVEYWLNRSLAKYSPMNKNYSFPVPAAALKLYNKNLERVSFLLTKSSPCICYYCISFIYTIVSQRY